MRGFQKNTIQVKGAEKFFQKENRQLEKARRRAARRATGRTRRLVTFAVAVLVVGGLCAFIRIQQTQINRLRALRDGEMEALRSRISALSAKLEESDRYVQTLKESATDLEKQVETEQAGRFRAEAALRARSAAKQRLPDGGGG